MDSEVLYFRNSSERGYAWQILEKKLPVIVFGNDYWDWFSVARPQLPVGVFIHELTHCYPGTGDWAYTTMTPDEDARSECVRRSQHSQRRANPG